MTALTSSNSNIQWASPFQWYYDLPNVYSDNYMVIVSEDGFLGTTGLGTCFAICARGQTKEGIPVLGLSHSTSVTMNTKKYEVCALKDEMIKKGCVAKTIDTYVVGGGRFGGKDGSTKKMEQEFLDLKKQGEITDVALNLTRSEDEEINVVFTSKSLYIAKAKSLFEASEENAEAGELITKTSSYREATGYSSMDESKEN